MKDLETRMCGSDPFLDAVWGDAATRGGGVPSPSRPGPSGATGPRGTAVKKRVRVCITRRPARAAHSPYSRPFTKGEAARLLEDAGIRHEGVERTYLAPWTAVCDPCSGRGPNVAQGIVASVKTVEGRGVRNVHLFFVYDEAEEGWRLVRAAVEVPV